MKARLVDPWVLGKKEETLLGFKLFIVLRKNKEVSEKLKIKAKGDLRSGSLLA